MLKTLKKVWESFLKFLEGPDDIEIPDLHQTKNTVGYDSIGW
jgi:hypothetical protein